MRVALLAFAGTILLGTAPFDDASAQWRKRAKEQPRSQTPIACTAGGGCAPIAPGCRIETGFTPDGMLSGYDSVVCPLR